MAAIKTIFWDLGGVVLTNGWDRDQRARVLTSLQVDLADYESRHDAANFFWERGLSTAYDFFAKTVFHADQPSRDFSYDELWSLVCAESKVLHPECIDILGKLYDARTYSLATLNNESRELNAHRLDAFRLRPYFDFFICSGYVHEMKPHVDIYRAAIEISGQAAEQTLFIDDKQENCDAAVSLGMQAIRFQSPRQLIADLAQLGIEAA
ncbi:HAD-IA family hydrolase [Granulicella arctica]|uniref:HAD-IA family hydrolase n=1 Tax=Granulicella arctica TaxID=940613 RepID=UPI0021E0F5A2|nr:HAD-IA family hydrolase [Granulicella arctica]